MTIPQLPQPLHDLIAGLFAGPECWILLVGLNLLGLILQKAPWFPNQWNKYISLILYLLGIVGALLVIPRTIFPPAQKNPMILIGVIGLIMAIVAFLVHDYPVQWLMNKFFPQAAGENRESGPNPGLAKRESGDPGKDI